MIIFTKEKISGQVLEGWQAICANPSCKGTNFFPDRKHLPHDVVMNKFRQRGWEVNSKSLNSTEEDFCQNCLHKKRAPRKAKVGYAGAAEKSIIAHREIQQVNRNSFRQVLSSAGIIVKDEADIIHLEDRRSKFKVIFRGTRELSIGRITHAEGEVLAAFNGTMVASTVKMDIQQRPDNHSFIFEPILIWYFTFEVQKNNVLAFDIAAE